jgi:hypothetical protein
MLPTTDIQWREGAIGTTQALYTNNFSADSQLGPYARTCQAAHILGRVLAHRDSRKDVVPRGTVLQEALQLDATLTALDGHLATQIQGFQPAPDHPNTPTSTAMPIDMALCTCARLALYGMYACNQPDVQAERFAEEHALQRACIEGIKQIVLFRAAALASSAMPRTPEGLAASSPLLLQALYDAATECQWLAREGEVVDPADAEGLAAILETLRAVGRRWQVASEFDTVVRA